MPVAQHSRGCSKELSWSQIGIYSEFQVSLNYIVRETDNRQSDLRKLLRLFR